MRRLGPLIACALLLLTNTVVLVGVAYNRRGEPEARLVHLLMIQLMPNATDLREKFPTLVYQALVERSTTRTESSAQR